jgi:hypothetical protein
MNGIFFEHSLDNAPSPIIRENVFVVCNKHGGNAPDVRKTKIGRAHV